MKLEIPLRLSLLLMVLVCGSTLSHGQTNSELWQRFRKAKVLLLDQEFEKASPILKSILPHLGNDSILMLKVYNNLGTCALYAEDVPTAIDYMKLTIKLSQRLQIDTIIGAASYNLGLTYKKHGEYALSAQYLFDAIGAFENSDMNTEIQKCYNVIGNIYRETGDYESSLNFHFKSNAMATRAEDKRGIASSLNNIGETYWRMDFNDSALYYFKLALELKLQLSDTIMLTRGYLNLGSAEMNAGFYEQAITHLNDAIRLSQLTKQQMTLVAALNYLGETETRMKKWDEARIHLEQARKIALDQDNAPLLYESLHRLRKLYISKGDFYSAAGLFEDEIRTKERILDQNTIAQIQNLSVIYKTKTLENERNKLIEESRIQTLELSAEKSQKTNYQLLALVAILLLIVAATLIWHSNKRMKEKSKHAQQIEALHKEMHHRIKNNFQTLQGLLTVQLTNEGESSSIQSIEKIRDRINAMALIHSLLLENPGEGISTVKFDQYLRALVENLAILFNLSDSVKINYDLMQVHLATDIAMPLALISNEIICNAFKHAFHDIKDPMLSVSLRREGVGVVWIEIEDNGSGIQNNESSAKSIGIQLIKSLANQIDAKYTVSGPGTAYKILLVV